MDGAQAAADLHRYKNKCPVGWWTVDGGGSSIYMKEMLDRFNFTETKAMMYQHPMHDVLCRRVDCWIWMDGGSDGFRM